MFIATVGRRYLRMVHWAALGEISSGKVCMCFHWFSTSEKETSPADTFIFHSPIVLSRIHTGARQL
jgi:hypothetical protein